MKIAILNYASGACEIIDEVPSMKLNEEVEAWLAEHGYNLDDIYYMTDCDVSFFRAEQLD